MDLKTLWEAFKAADPKNQKKVVMVGIAVIVIILGIATQGRAEEADWNRNPGWVLFHTDAMRLMPAEWQADFNRVWEAYYNSLEADVPGVMATTAANLQPEVCFRNAASGRLASVGSLQFWYTN